MPEMFASGRIVDLVIILVAFELIVLGVARARTGRGPRLSEVGPFLAAGTFLLLALRLALVGGRWEYIGLALALSGVAHGLDLAGRYRR